MSRPRARRVVQGLVPLVLVSVCGCFSAVRLLHETPDGGMIVMPNNSNQWPTYYRNRAEYLMHKKCPDGYVLDHEEVIEDNPASRDGRYPWEDFDYNGGYQRITTSERKQYRITFRRVRASSEVLPLVTKGPPPPPPPAATEDLMPPRPVPIQAK
jgi:hypothetical protein